MLVQHESYECKCRLNESVCNSKQKYNNNNDCRCECKELDDSCGFMICDCESNKSMSNWWLFRY